MDGFDASVNFILSLLVNAGIRAPRNVWSIDFSWRAIVALTLGYGAFISEISREAVGKRGSRRIGAEW
jgi:ABC-type amino acid transport system permease subunit